MKKVITLSVLILAITVVVTSCKNKRLPGSVYVPDMADSRTYETYSELDSLKFTSDIHDKGGNKIFFNAMPVPGTIKRGGEEFSYPYQNDSIGYKMSATVASPIGALTGAEMSEAGRLYDINCGICHGEKGTANGPLSAKIGGIANLTLDLYKVMPEGTMFHSITYGKNNMGSYSSQLTSKQRWMVVRYVKSMQGAVAATTTVAVTDSTKTKKK